MKKGVMPTGVDNTKREWTFYGNLGKKDREATMKKGVMPTEVNWAILKENGTLRQPGQER